MPVKCIADGKLVDAEGKPFVGFAIYGGKHGGQFIQGEIYPDGDGYLLKKYVYDFEAVEAKPQPPKKKPKEKPADSNPSPEKGDDD